MQRVFCDACKEEIKQAYGDKTYYVGIDVETPTGMQKAIKTLECCPACFTKVQVFLLGVVK
jgi:hypothetical protein